MRYAHIAFLGGVVLGILSPISSRADLIVVSGTITQWGSTDPVNAGQSPSTFTAFADFSPQSYSKYGVEGPSNWTVVLNGGALLTNQRPGTSLRAFSGLDFLDSGSTHEYNLVDYRTGSPDVSTFVELHAQFTPSFVFEQPPGAPPSDRSGEYRSYLLSDESGFLSGTFSFSRYDGPNFTTMEGVVTSVNYAVPEPGTLLVSILGVTGMVGRYRWRRGRRPSS